MGSSLPQYPPPRTALGWGGGGQVAEKGAGPLLDFPSLWGEMGQAGRCLSVTTTNSLEVGWRPPGSATGWSRGPHSEDKPAGLPQMLRYCEQKPFW